jgi:ATP-binding cassette subfamily B protein
MLTWPLIALGWVVNLFQRGAASMTRLLDVLDARPEIRSPADPIALPATSGGRTLEFRDVGFHFPARRDTSRAGCCATSPSPCRRARRSPSSARRAAGRAR